LKFIDVDTLNKIKQMTNNGKTIKGITKRFGIIPGITKFDTINWFKNQQKATLKDISVYYSDYIIGLKFKYLTYHEGQMKEELHKIFVSDQVKEFDDSLSQGNNNLKYSFSTITLDDNDYIAAIICGSGEIIDSLNFYIK